MKRSDIITVVTQETGMKKRDVVACVEAYEAAIKKEVVAGGSVVLSGFLKVENKSIAPRKRFIPATQQLCEMAPHNTVKVTVSKSFKDQLK